MNQQNKLRPYHDSLGTQCIIMAGVILGSLTFMTLGALLYVLDCARRPFKKTTHI
jgi:hypothetical protein